MALLGRVVVLKGDLYVCPQGLSVELEELVQSQSCLCRNLEVVCPNQAAGVEGRKNGEVFSDRHGFRSIENNNLFDSSKKVM